MGARGRRASYGLGWLSALFKAAFAEQPTISPAAYAVYNLAAGFVLVLIGGTIWGNPKLGSQSIALCSAAGDCS